MKIKVGDDTFLNSDQYCYWITERRVADDTKRIRETRVSGYCGSIEQAIFSYCERRIRASETSSMTGLKRELARLRKDIKEMIECLNVSV